MEDYSDAIPVELWHMVFSLLSFEDHRNCRLVCKHWLDLVNSLREFESNNCLRLEYCLLSENEPPLTVLQDSSLKFSGLIVGNKICFKFSPNLSMRLAQIAETVTYLDLCQPHPDGKVLRLFVENLGLFKVLNQLKLFHMSHLLDVAFKEISFNKILFCVLNKLLTKQPGNVITIEDVRDYFENENFEIFIEKEALEGYKDFLVEEITNNLDQLNQADNKSRKIWEVTNIIANKIRDLEEKTVNTPLPGSRNESVRILSVEYIEVNRPSNDDLGLIFQLLPNLQEYQILLPVHCNDKSVLELIEVHLDMTSEYSVIFNHFHQLNICNLPSLQGLKSLKLRNYNHRLAKLHVTNLLKKYPTLNSVGLVNFSLPQDNFQYFTEFAWEISSVSNLDLTNLSMFKNLSYLQFFDFGRSRTTPCFTVNHHPFTLESMKTFIFNIGKSEYCQDCFCTLLKSFPNLSDLDFIGKSEDVNSIFQYQANLVELNITVKLLTIRNTDWPEMKRLRKLELTCEEIVGDKDDWDRFTKKLDRLKYLKILSGCCLDVRKIFETVNMPWLQQVKFYEKDESHLEIVVRNGRKVLVKFHPREIEDSDDDDDSAYVCLDISSID